MFSQNNLDGREAAYVYSLPSVAYDIRLDLLTLRNSVTLAWRERGVMLTREEQRELKAEIADLCELLKDLTGSHD